MNKNLIASFLVTIILISGCNNNTAGDVTGSVQVDDVKALEMTIESQQQIIHEQEEKLKKYNSIIEDLESTVTSLENTMNLLDVSQHLTSSIVQNVFKSETGIVENSEYDKDKLNVTVRRSEVVTDENNQFNGLKKSDESIELSIDKDLPVFLLDRGDQLLPRRIHWSEIKTMNLNGVFLKLYMRDGKVVFIEEKYIP